MRIAIDTNILVYFEGVNGEERKKTSVELIRRLPQSEIFLPIQVLGELFRVLLKKARWSPARTRTAVLSWQESFSLIETSPVVLLAAMDLAADHGLGIWDAIILAAASSAGCRLLLSEDFHDGFTWNGVTVANPLVPIKNELLRGILGS